MVQVVHKKKKKKDNLQTFHVARTKVATEYDNLRRQSTKKVPAGTLEEMIKKATIEFGLQPGSLKKDSVLARLKRNNVSGIAHQKVSPLDELEPLIVE
jgi:hypothetical protein